MKINKKLEIGMNAVSALKNKEGFVQTKMIALELGTSVFFLEQIMRNLRTADIVQVKRGPGGGYILNKVNSYTALDVAKAVGRFPDNLVEGDVSLTAQLKQNILEAFRNIKL